jgi:hypothetical protein
MDWTLTPDELKQIDQAIAERGQVPSK